MATSSKENSFECACEEEDPSSLYDKLTASISENIKNHKAKNELYMNEIRALQSELKSFKIVGIEKMLSGSDEDDNERNLERRSENELEFHENQQYDREIGDYESNYAKKHEKYQDTESNEIENSYSRHDNTSISEEELEKEMENNQYEGERLSRNSSKTKFTEKENCSSTSKERISTLDIRKALRQEARRLRGSPENSPKQEILKYRNNSSSLDEEDSIEEIESLHKYDSEEKRKKSSKKKKKDDIITKESEKESLTKNSAGQDEKLKDENKQKKETSIKKKLFYIPKETKKDNNINNESEHKLYKTKNKTMVDLAEQSQSSYSNCLTNSSLKTISNNEAKDCKLPFSPSSISLRISTSPSNIKSRYLMMSPSKATLNTNLSPKKSFSYEKSEENINTSNSISKKKSCLECLSLLKRGVSTSHCSIHGFNSSNITSKMRL